MRNAKYLLRLAELLQVLADRHGHLPAYARVDLVEDQAVDRVRAGEDGLGGQGDAGELAPEAILARGLAFSPGLGAIRNSTSSTPKGPTTGLPSSRVLAPDPREELGARHAEGPDDRLDLGLEARRPRPSASRRSRGPPRGPRPPSRRSGARSRPCPPPRSPGGRGGSASSASRARTSSIVAPYFFLSLRMSASRVSTSSSRSGLKLQGAEVVAQRVGDVLELVEGVVAAPREVGEARVDGLARSRGRSAGAAARRGRLRPRPPRRRRPRERSCAASTAAKSFSCWERRRSSASSSASSPALELGLGDLLDREAQELDLAAPLGLGGEGRLVGPLLRRKLGEACAEGDDLVLDPGVAVEELAVVLGQEEGLVLVLAVEVDEEGRELGEVGAEGALVLDVGRAAAVGLDAAADEDPALLGLEAPGRGASPGPPRCARRRGPR